MPQNAAEVRVGRLLEVRTDRGYHALADVEDMRRRLTLAFERIAGGRPAIIAADWRKATVMDGEAAQSACTMIASFNHRVERSGILVSSDSPVAVLQFHHLARETQHPQRRVFHWEEEMASWLGEVLSDEERKRLGEFLGRR